MSALQIAMYRGDDKSFPFTLTQGGLAVDLTGATVTFSARVAADFDVDEAAAIVVTPVTQVADQPGAGKGKVTLVIRDTATVALAPGLYLCDFEVNEAGEVWTWPEAIYGVSTLIRLRVKADVTRP